ncbi:ArsR/SmtB family transcription factor [Magnetospirillum sulfuroxidans]|uniref:Helix-turn-helix transcriptional regulator n=1 Tax=Magnetospirillum sulfuroxidans TaxID=611300 RepID=A0ABS5IAU1_9PROT|nr:helix-turn-helix domain-containing protein [Magnetospirillum sulfuroxidans]MBR9971505.1 helix-turn-helix transcriptional regulator [Magnetospirillum sulfuroxidans]
MEISEALEALTSLSQEIRLRVFRLLVTASPHGLPAGAIAEELAVPANTLSFHLNHLRHAGLVSVRRQGRMQIYTARCDQVEFLKDFLTENCCTKSSCAS